jgi:hypothetical protein
VGTIVIETADPLPSSVGQSESDGATTLKDSKSDGDTAKVVGDEEVAVPAPEVPDFHRDIRAQLVLDAH